MTTVSQSSTLLRSFWPKLKGFSPLSLVREKASARLAEQSVTRARVAALVHAEIIPRLTAHATTPVPNAAKPLFSALEIQQAADLALDPDETALITKVEALRNSGMSMDVIEHEFIAQIARYLGECWNEDSRSFTDVTLACGRLQAVMRYINESEPIAEAIAANSANVMLLAADEEQHTLGLTMVAEAFRREGWQVTGPFLGGEDESPSSHRDAQVIATLKAVSEQWFDVVGVSIGCELRKTWVTELVADLRAKALNPQLKILVGGAVLNNVPNAHLQVGADGHAADARHTPALAKKLLASELNCKS